MVLGLSSLIKPIRVILCTDEDNPAILVLALSQIPIQSKETGTHVSNCIVNGPALIFNRNESAESL